MRKMLPFFFFGICFSLICSLSLIVFVRADALVYNVEIAEAEVKGVSTVNKKSAVTTSRNKRPLPTKIVASKAKPTRTPTPSLTSTPSPTPTPIRIPTSTPTLVPTATPLSASTKKVQISPTQAVAQQITVQAFIMNEINTYRASQGLSSVQTQTDVCAFARTRAQEIVSSFNHNGFRERINNNSLPYSSYSSVTENIAMNADYKGVVTQWINSSGHAENMRKDTPFVCVENSGNYYAYEGWKP